MDQYDEKNDQNDGAKVERTGDVLGLGGALVPKMPGDPSASDDPESVAQPRQRAPEDDTTLTPDRDDPDQPS